MSGEGPEQPGHDDDREPAAGQPAWQEAGFTDEQARNFRRWRFTVAEAVAWRQAGVPDGLRAAQWATAGVTSATVGDWRAAGIDSSQAVHWHEMGFDLPAARDAVRRGLTPDAAFGQRTRVHFSGTTPGLPALAISGVGGHGLSGRQADLFRQLMHERIPPDVIAGYARGNWATEDALAWARAGIYAADALVWQALGLTPAEAARLQRKGATPADTMRDWWRAGIPFDEVADWIGAGLTAQEAADQRARGVTAEQAATLRALRDQEEDDS